jgi:hypothetical protein
VMQVAERRGLLVIVTTADDPFNAQRDLAEHLPSIAKNPTKGPVVQVSSRAPVWRPISAKKPKRTGK